MMPDEQPAANALRFNLRTALALVAFIAILFGWYASSKQSRDKNARLIQQLLNARSQVSLAESRGEFQAERTSDGRPLFSKPRVEGVSLRGAVIQAGDSAFQRTSFDNSDLSGASLTGGGASFQGASFKNARLRNAKLVGGGSSFQLATFDNADLSGAVLNGNLQGVSLKNANCTGITIIGSFQAANIDSAKFQSADLSAIRNEDLASCYYKTPPTYDAQTKLPARFDPTAHGWRLAPAGAGSK